MLLTVAWLLVPHGLVELFWKQFSHTTELEFLTSICAILCTAPLLHDWLITKSHEGSVQVFFFI